MSGDISNKSRKKNSTRVDQSFFSTKVTSILEPHKSEYKCNILKSIAKHGSLYEHFIIVGESTPKLCKFRIRYFHNMDKITKSLDRCMMNNNLNKILK